MDNKEYTTPEFEEIETAEAAETDGKNAKKEKLADGRRFRFGALATALTAVVVAAVVLLNVLVSALDVKFPLTFDTTGDKVLTLSDTTKDLARSIKEPVRITACINEEYFSAPNTGNKEIDTVLTQFYAVVKQLSSLSDGKISYAFVDLTKDVTEAAALSSYDVSDGEILFTCGKRSNVIGLDALMEYDSNYNQYMQYQQYGMSYTGDYTFTSLVEPAIVSGIQAVLNESLAPVTMVVGHGEDQNVVTTLTEVLKKNGYEVLTLDISTMENTFDEKTSMAILPAPSTDYSADELALLRTWAANDGYMNHQLTYVVNYSVYLPSLSEFFADNYGIEVTPYWVSETTNARIFANGSTYTYGDVAETDYTDEQEKAVKAPATIALKLLWDEDKTLAKYNQAVVTFPNSAQLIDYAKYTAGYKALLENVDVNDLTNNQKSELQQKIDALVAENTAQAEKYPIVGMAYARTEATVDGIESSTSALVCGSAGMLATYLGDTASKNEAVFTAAFNGINGIQKTLSVPGKSLSNSTVDFGSEGVKKLLGLGVFTVLLPLAMLICGLSVFLRRKNL